MKPETAGEREAFEAWWKRNPHRATSRVDFAFDAWLERASREAQPVAESMRIALDALAYIDGNIADHPYICQRTATHALERIRALAAPQAGQPPERAPDIYRWRDPELAASPTPKAQVGTWTLTAPDGRTWQADSPLKVCATEQRERVPAQVGLARIVRALDEDAAPLEPREKT